MFWGGVHGGVVGGSFKFICALCFDSQVHTTM